MFGNFSSKLKNLFKSKKNTVSTKQLDKLDNGLTIDDMIRYKNLIPNLLDEFIDQNKSNKRRANSFSLKNTKLTISEKSLIHSNSGLLKKLQKKLQKKANVRISIGRHYFLGSTAEDAKHLTTKNVRRGSVPEKKEKIIKEKEEKEENEGNEEIKKKDEKNKKNEFSGLRSNTIRFDKIPKRQTLKRKKTIDPQDTVEANNIQFEIKGEEEFEISDTKDKLEEYQEKMRKTQLRYYVFKKITNYKSSLRRYFQKYRTIVQLMEAVEEKNEETKENDLETKNKKIKILKNILKNRTYKEHKELNKYLLRFYYNCKYAAGIANLNKILNKEKKENKDKNDSKNENKNEIKNQIKNEETKKKEEINTNDNSKNKINNINENASNNNNEQVNQNFLDAIKGEIKKEEEKKELTPEEIEKAKRKRNKELRDLFYNKVRERQKWLHDHFVKFYYKGLLWAMKTGNIRNNTSSSSETKSVTTPITNSSNNNTNTNINTNSNQTTEVKPENTDNSKDNNNIINKPSSEIDILNINKEIEKKEEKNEEKKEDEEKKNKKVAFNKIRDRSKGLRKLLSEKNKEKNNILRKYFFKFLSNGILLSLKKTTLKSSKTLSNIIDQPEDGQKDENAKKEEEENNWIIEEKKRRKLEEEQKQKELKEKITKILVIIFNKKDQILCARQRSCLQKWNLRAKIIAIGDLTIGFRKSKKGKGKKKIKKKDGKNKDKKENEEGNEENKEINENK